MPSLTCSAAGISDMITADDTRSVAREVCGRKESWYRNSHLIYYCAINS